MEEKNFEKLVQFRKFLEEKVEEYKRYSNEQNIGAPFTDRLMGYDHAKKKLDELFPEIKKLY